MNWGVIRRLRGLALWAICAPFILLSFIPSGVMPIRAENGALMVVICDGDGMAEIAVDPVTLEPVKETPYQKGEPCAWALVQIPVDLASRPELSPGSSHFSILDVSLAETVLAIAQETGLPPATGPPSVV